MGNGDSHELRRPLLKNELISKIIAAPKITTSGLDPKWRRQKDQAHWRAELQLECAYPCRIALRKSIDNPLNFSILLIYTQWVGRDVIIVRYNGDHGLHINKRTGERIRGPHIHMITEEYQRHGGKPEGFATATCEYRTFDEALATFISDMSVRTWKL